MEAAESTQSVNSGRGADERAGKTDTAGEANAGEANAGESKSAHGTWGLFMPQGEGGLGIHSLRDILSDERIAAHLAAMLPAQAARYASLLPPSVSPQASDMLRVVRSGFFHRARDELSSALSHHNVGALLAHTWGYPYAGEGIEPFLRGLRASEVPEEEPPRETEVEKKEEM